MEVYGSIDYVYTVYLYSILWCHDGQGHSDGSIAKGGSFSWSRYSSNRSDLERDTTRLSASCNIIGENLQIVISNYGWARSRDEAVDDL